MPQSLFFFSELNDLPETLLRISEVRSAQNPVLCLRIHLSQPLQCSRSGSTQHL